MSAPVDAKPKLVEDVPLAVRASLEAVNGTVRDGLTRVDALAVGRGYFDFTAGVTSANQGAGFIRAETGLHPLENVSFFGYGQATAPLGVNPDWTPTFEAGIGGRVRW